MVTPPVALGQKRVGLAGPTGSIIVSDVTSMHDPKKCPFVTTRLRDRGTWWLHSFVWWAVCLVTTSGQAQIISAAGDDNDLWVLLLDDDRTGFTILHRNTLDKPNVLYPVEAIQGKIAPEGIACADGRVWLIYEHTSAQTSLTVQSIAVNLHGRPAGHRYDAPQFQPGLPHGVFLRSMTANRRGPWTLVRVEQLSSLQQIDADGQLPSEPSTQTQTNATDQPDPQQSSPAPPSTPDAEPIAAEIPHSPKPAKTQAVREDRLLRLDRTKWVKVDLPQDWPKDARSWLIMRHNDDLYPMLVTMTSFEDGHMIQTYRYESDRWQPHHVITRPGGTRGDLGGPPGDENKLNPRTAIALPVDGQLVIGSVSNLAQQVNVELFVWRPTGVSPLGTLSIDRIPLHAWAMAPHGPIAALLGLDDHRQLAWTQINLQGQVTDPTSLSEHVIEPLAESVDLLMLVAVVMISLLIMLVFWRREAAWNRLDLPAEMTLADLSWRAIAAVIDLLPCLVVAMILFKVRPQQLAERWPGQSGGWQQMLPGVTAIALYVIHATATELFTSKTVGKTIMGMRVATLDGLPPNVWQVLARNSMKVFDLIAWPLLIMPLVGPYRQRLGDLAARTVVVTDRSTDDSGSSRQDPPHQRSSKDTDEHDSHPMSTAR